MKYTSNCNLKKPDATDFYDVKDCNDNMDVIDEKMGNLSELETTEKNSLVSAINEVFQSGSKKKATLVSNLTAMGVMCNINDSWETLLKKVLDIFTGTDVSDTTAIAQHVVAGEKFHTKDGSLATGTMTNNSAYINATACWQTGDSIGLTYPTGAYLQETSEGHTTLCVSTGGMAYALGVDGSKMLQGYTVSGVEGSIPVSREWMQTTHWWLDQNNYNLCFHFNTGAYLLDDGGGNGCGWIDAPHVRDVYGITGDKIAKGQSICGVTGEYEGSNGKYASGTFNVTEIRTINDVRKNYTTYSGDNYDGNVSVFDFNTNLDWNPVFVKAIFSYRVKASASSNTSVRQVHIKLMKDTTTCLERAVGQYERSLSITYGTHWINGTVVTFPIYYSSLDALDLATITWEAWG